MQIACCHVPPTDALQMLYGTDHNGNVCGRGSQAGKHELYFPQLQKDLLRAYTADPRKYNPLNGGFIIFRKNAPTDRWFACTERLIRKSDYMLNELQAYDNLSRSGNARSTAMRLVSPTWFCGAEPKNALNASLDGGRTPCPFVHGRGVLADASHA